MFSCFCPLISLSQVGIVTPESARDSLTGWGHVLVHPASTLRYPVYFQLVFVWTHLLLQFTVQRKVIMCTKQGILEREKCQHKQIISLYSKVSKVNIFYLSAFPTALVSILCKPNLAASQWMATVVPMTWAHSFFLPMQQSRRTLAKPLMFVKMESGRAQCFGFTLCMNTPGQRLMSSATFN